ncbi:MAG TPA: AAA family ATPase, partial [Chitinophagaceae bacterium]
TQLPCLWGDILLKVGLVCLAGGSDTGKSSFARGLGIACAVGESDYLEYSLYTEHKSVIFVSSEDDQMATSFLLGKQAKKYEPARLKNLRFIFNIDNNLIETLDRKLTKKRADIIIMDCLADVYGNDLKDTQKIRSFLHPYQELAVKHKCLILFIHHTGQRTEQQEPSKNNLLSGQGLEAKMRMVMELRSDLVNPSVRHLCIVKGNYIPMKLKRESFILRFDEETFTFTNTGERAPFELLVKQNEDQAKARYLQAKELQDAGYNYDKIAEVIGYDSKGSITKLFQRAQKNGWDKSVSNRKQKKQSGNL